MEKRKMVAQSHTVLLTEEVLNRLGADGGRYKPSANDEASGMWTSSDASDEDSRSEKESDSCSSDYSSSCSSDYSSDLSEGLEDMINSISILHKSVSCPAIPSLKSKPSPLISKAKLEKENLVRVDSSPFLQNMDDAPVSLKDRMMKADKIDVDLGPKSLVPKQLSLVPRLKETSSTVFHGLDVNPEIHFSNLLQKQGVIMRKFDALNLKNFFLDISEENIAGYDMAKTIALRAEDLDTFRQMLQQGENLQVCNRFGESLLHAACRRGSIELLRFFLDEAKISLKVIDDYGRTVMHDTCWTNKPNFEVAQLVLDTCPDLLWIADKRGSLPLQYVRKDQWNEWSKFLEKNENMLIPRELCIT